MDSSFNDVDFHVQILEESKLENFFFLFAGHSGDGMVSYFNDLEYLEEGDIILIFMDDKKIFYVVEKIYYIQKTGKFFAPLENMENMLYLITCSLKYYDKQLIVQARLVDQINVLSESG